MSMGTSSMMTGALTARASSSLANAAASVAKNRPAKMSRPLQVQARYTAHANAPPPAAACARGY